MLADNFGLMMATLALLVNPYGFHAWTFPLTLLERIDGGSEVFDRILEFAPAGGGKDMGEGSIIDGAVKLLQQ